MAGRRSPRTKFDRRQLLQAVLATACFFYACDRRPPLANTRGSAQELGAAVLEALESQDRARLDALALSEPEFRDHVWPDLPASQPERNLPFSYVWGDLHQKSDLGLSTALAEHGGKRYELKRVVFGGETAYDHYRVHREATFDVIDASGNQMSLRVCGSFIEKDGVWKVFSYVIDD